MNTCKPEPATRFCPNISAKQMNEIRKILDLDERTPLIILEPNIKNDINILVEEESFVPGLPKKEVTLKHIECITITRSHASNHTTVTSGGNSYSVEVFW